MAETMILLPVFVGGLALGAFFFGGLRWTVQRGLGSQHPALWFCGSYLLRTAVLLAGLYALSGGRWQRLLACLLGCIAARLVATRLGQRADKAGKPGQVADHAA